MPIREMKPRFNVLVLAPLPEGKTLAVVEELGRRRAFVLVEGGRPEEELSLLEARDLVLASYPSTARPGCCPLWATASGEINR